MLTASGEVNRRVESWSKLVSQAAEQGAAEGQLLKVRWHPRPVSLAYCDCRAFPITALTRMSAIGILWRVRLARSRRLRARPAFAVTGTVIERVREMQYACNIYPRPFRLLS